MKKSSLVLVALLLALPVFADEVKTEQLLTLASIDTSASVNLQNLESTDLGARVDQDVKLASAVLSAKLTAELPALITEKAVNVKF